MEDRINSLFQEWHQLGGAALVAEVKPVEDSRRPEIVIAESTAHCRDSGRLTWIVLDWLIRHIDRIDEEILIDETRRMGDLSVLGILCDAAQRRISHVKFEKILKNCVKHKKLELFFHRVAKSRLASRLARKNAIEIFLRWNYISNELRYL